MNSDDYVLEDIAQSFEHRVTLNRIKERCSPDAGNVSRSVAVTLSSNLSAQFEFGTVKPDYLLVNIESDGTGRPYEGFAQISIDTSELARDCPIAQLPDITFLMIGLRSVKTLNQKSHLFKTATNKKFMGSSEILLSMVKPYEKLKFVIKGNYHPSTDISLHDDMLRLYREGDETDVVVFAGGKEFKVHKSILKARSAYFRAMFDSGMTEAQSGKVTVENADPKALNALLEFLYCAISPNNLDDIAWSLLPLADRLGVDALARLSALSVARSLDRADGYKQVFKAIRLANQCRSETLLEACFQTFEKHLHFALLSNFKRIDQLRDLPEIQAKLFPLILKKVNSLACWAIMAALVCADKYNCEDLKKACLRRFKLNAKKIVETKPFLSLDVKSPLHRELLLVVVASST